jgi:general stress protein 26
MNSRKVDFLSAKQTSKKTFHFTNEQLFEMTLKVNRQQVARISLNSNCTTNSFFSLVATMKVSLRATNAENCGGATF